MNFESHSINIETKKGEENESQEHRPIEPLLQQIDDSELTPEGKQALKGVIENTLEMSSMSGSEILSSYVLHQRNGDIVLFEDRNEDGLRRATLVDCATGDGLWALIEPIPDEMEKVVLDYAVNEPVPMPGRRSYYGKDQTFHYSPNEIEEVLLAYGKLHPTYIEDLKARKLNPTEGSSLHTEN